jgi:hypothetical protein
MHDVQQGRAWAALGGRDDVRILGGRGNHRRIG